MSRVFGWEGLSQFGGTPHTALSDQIRTLAKEPLQARAGVLSPADERAAERALRVQLGLP